MKVIITETLELKEIPFTIDYMREIGAMECGTLEWNGDLGWYMMADWVYDEVMAGSKK